MQYLLGSESPLAEWIDGFGPRPGQLAMAEACARTFGQGVPLAVEAATGTGKTLAYLGAALISGLKVIISTGTKTLQDQVATGELPLLQKALAPQLRFAVLKGRSNYLCRRRFKAFTAQPDLELPGAAGTLERLRRWAETTGDGDLDEVRGAGLTAALVSEVTANGEQCLAGRCPLKQDCFLTEARRRAAEADLVVVNHHLFMADLRLKAEGHGEALPRYQAVVFDEAHMLPEVATQAFGVSVSSRRLRTLLRDLTREAANTKAINLAALACQKAAEDFFGRVGRLLGHSGRVGLTPAHLEALTDPGRALADTLEALAAGLGDNEEEEALATRAVGLAMDLQAVARPVAGQSVAWAEGRGRGAILHLSPVEVGPHLQHALYQHEGRLVFTSATLAPEGDLSPFIDRLGLEQDTHRLVVDSPFDLAASALLYVPPKMPLPSAPNFTEAVARQVEALLARSGGRAFVLFTSRRNLEAVSRDLADRLDYHCLVQGQAPRMELLERFKAESPSVLFATASFWQGVDVPGPALSAVIVDKLPFAPPDDPLVAARCAKVEAGGGSGFAHVMLPEAILDLKQGLGRLLRTSADRGLLAVLDARLVTKGYGRRFLKALKPIPLTQSMDEVAAFFAAEDRR